MNLSSPLPASMMGLDIPAKNWSDMPGEPTGPERERRFIGTCIGDPASFEKSKLLPADAFFVGSNRIAWLHICRAPSLNDIGRDVRENYAHEADTFAHTSDTDYLVARLIARRGVAYGKKLIEELARAEKPADTAPFTVWTPDELLAWQPPADAVIVGDAERGYIVREELSVIIGPPGVGKSRLVLWLALCAITGREFAGLKTLNGPTKWLIFGNENSRSRLRHDLAKMISALPEADADLVRTNLRLHVLDQPRDGHLDLSDPETRGAIASTLRQHDPDVATFDPWANLVGGDENKNQDVRDSVRHLLNLMRLNAPRAACIVVHHARTGAATVSQAGNRFAGASLSRGGKALPSAARCEIAVWPGDPADSSKIVVTCEKSNNAPVFSPRGLRLDPETMTYSVDHSFSVESWKDDVEGKRRDVSVSIADVVEVVRSLYRPGEDVNTGSVVDPLRDQTGASAKTIQRRMKEALEAGYIREGSKRGTWRLGAKPIKK